MGTILGSWSGMRKYLEQEMLAESLRGRIRYGCTTYVGMDGCRIFEVCIDNKQIKRFSWETVNTYFIDNGLKSDPDPTKVAVGVQEYWHDYWRLLDEVPMHSRTEYTDREFCDALKEYRSQSIQDSIHSENVLIRMFAVLDRRLGKRTLKSLKNTVESQPEWLQAFYRLRFEAEGV